MANYLKKGKSQTEISAGDAKIRKAVEDILAAIAHRGDAALREHSERLDSWNPERFRLSAEEIQRCHEEVPEQVKDDIRFAQAQIRGFAQHQLEALREVEVETLPGVVLGHKNIPVNSVGCYVPGGRYPMVASAHMSVDRQGGGRGADHRHGAA